MVGQGKPRGGVTGEHGGARQADHLGEGDEGGRVGGHGRERAGTIVQRGEVLWFDCRGWVSSAVANVRERMNRRDAVCLNGCL